MKSRKGQCLTQVNEWVRQFNSKVQTIIANLNKKLSGANLKFADSYPAVFDLINNPTAYGQTIIYFSLYSIMMSYKTINGLLISCLQASRFQIHHAAMWTRASGDCVCQTRNYAEIVGIMCFGMPSTLLMQQMKCLPTSYLPVRYSLHLLHRQSPIDSFLPTLYIVINVYLSCKKVSL